MLYPTSMTQSRAGEEMLQCYDEKGNPTELHTRTEVRQEPPRFWFAVSRIWLVNGLGQVMCSKRSQGVSSHAGKWQTYFGGHVAAGDTILETAQRELEEEAGLHRPLEDFFLIKKGRNDKKKVFFESFAVRFDGMSSDLRFSDREVSEAKWMDLDEYMREKEAHPSLWCNECTPENQKAIRDWLGL